MLAAASRVRPTLDLGDFVNCYFGSSGARPAPKPTESASKSNKERTGTRPLKAVESETASPTSKDKESAVTDRRYSGNRHDRKESERFKSFTYEELTKRDKAGKSNMPGFPRHTQDLGASRRRARRGER
jgi:hypothetical protein